MKYKCLIAENNLLERDLLEMLLRQIEQVDLVAVCDDGLAALQVLMDREIDIVFTDIDMPNLSGINLLKSLKKPPVFIFISAYAEYAVDGFDLDVVDFIVKPIKAPRLFKAFDKAREYIERNAKAETRPEADTDIYIARTSDGFQKIKTTSIVFAESKGNFSLTHLLDKKELLVLVNLKHLEDQMSGADFLRVHRNFIVNWSHAVVINTAGIKMAEEHTLPIGEAYRKGVTDRIAGHKMLSREVGK